VLRQQGQGQWLLLFARLLLPLVGLRLRLQDDLLHLLLYGINVTMHWQLVPHHLQDISWWPPMGQLVQAAN
jgi:hypothetical protein